jgi:hypothetical protein
MPPSPVALRNVIEANNEFWQEAARRGLLK